MRKQQLISWVTLTLAACVVVYPQSRHDTTYMGEGVYRVERCEKYCSYPASLSEVVLNANNVFQEDAQGSGKLLVRVCSKDSMPVAIATAAIEPDDVLHLTRGFESSAFKLRVDDVVIGRSESCSGKLPNTTPAELLAVPRNSSLPPVIESIKACQVRTRWIATGTDSDPLIRLHQAGGFRRAIKRLVAELKNNPQSTGFVLGYHLKNETKLMRSRLREARQVLAESGLPAARFVVRTIPQYGYDATTSAEADFFSVKTVQVMPDCASTPTNREMLIAK